MKFLGFIIFSSIAIAAPVAQVSSDLEKRECNTKLCKLTKSIKNGFSKAVSNVKINNAYKAAKNDANDPQVNSHGWGNNIKLSESHGKGGSSNK